MKNPRIFSLFCGFVLILLAGCKDDCDGKLCFTPPEPFLFDLVNKDTGENVFLNGAFKKSDIEIMDIDNGDIIEYDFIDDIGVFQVGKIGWETGRTNYAIKLSDETVFTFHVDAERLAGDCCSYTRYNVIEFKGAEFELKNEQNFKVFIDQ